MSSFPKVYKYAGPWWAPVRRQVASKAWREAGKPAARKQEEPPAKKLGWVRLNEILSGQIKANMAFNAQKKKEEEELQKKIELLKKKEEEEYFHMYMAEEVEEVFPEDVHKRTSQWAGMVPQWTLEAATKVYTYDGPWGPEETPAPPREQRREEGFLASNGWVFDSTRYLARECLHQRMRGL